MKLSHAASLALVGWYLMVPPTIAIGDWVAPYHSDLFVTSQIHQIPNGPKGG
jgi:hypothetical protein